ncbi:MAG TPA: type II CAAX endopeptidase family protein [Kofleriaceae bacterium]
MRWLRRHPIACYLGVAFAVTWGAWVPLAATGHVVTAGFAPIYLAGLLGPLAGAVGTSAIVAGTDGVRAVVARMLRVRVGARWWAVGLGLPLAVALVLAAGGLAIATFGIGHEHGWRDLGAFNGFPVTSPLGLWLLLVLVNGFGEETGWRGYLLPHLQKRWSPLTSSLIVGAIWCVWHVPAFFVSETYRQMSVAMIPVFVVGLLSGSVFLTWLYNRGRSSILLVAVWHGTYNWLSGSVGARGVFAAVESTVVMAIAAVLVIREIVAIRRDHRGRPAHHLMAPRRMPARPPIW